MLLLKSGTCDDVEKEVDSSGAGGVDVAVVDKLVTLGGECGSVDVNVARVVVVESLAPFPDVCSAVTETVTVTMVLVLVFPAMGTTGTVVGARLVMVTRSPGLVMVCVVGPSVFTTVFTTVSTTVCAPGPLWPSPLLSSPGSRATTLYFGFGALPAARGKIFA